MIDAVVQAVANEVERILNPPVDNVVPLRARGADSGHAEDASFERKSGRRKRKARVGTA